MMDTLDKIALLLTAVRNDPDNFEKQAAYFKALADARLDDFYNVHDDYESWKARAEKAEADYAKLCNAVVGANCHVDHAIETLDEERKQKWLTLQSLAAEESDKILYRNQRDDLAYELNQTINYLITLEQGNPLRPIADTIAHLVAVLRNMNTAIDELNATLLEGGE